MPPRQRPSDGVVSADPITNSKRQRVAETLEACVPGWMSGLGVWWGPREKMDLQRDVKALGKKI